MSKNKYALQEVSDTSLKGQTPIIEVNDYTLSFKLKEGGQNKLVIRNTSLNLYKGEVLALVGESGSGKSVITTAMMGLLPDSAVVDGGTIKLKDIDVTTFSDREWNKNKLRGKVISSVFQNPMTTLNPTIKVGKQVVETAMVNKVAKNKKHAKEMTLEFFKKLKLDNPKELFNKYPHELSGGMKQRIVIAAALIAKPDILILDEPTTALDPTIQAEILSILIDLKKEINISIIFITHDLGVVAAIADRIAIMYAGKVVEHGKTSEVLWNSKHPYTWGLLLSMPDINKNDELYNIPGAVPSNLNLISYDAFAPRNIFALKQDFIANPPFFKVSETHFVASWLYDSRTPTFEPPKQILERWIHFNKKGAKNG